jgi:DNA replication protein DnaC
MFERLATLDFITKKKNIILTGASVVEKSHLAQALGNQACLNGERIYNANTARLISMLKLSKVAQIEP